MKTNIAILLFTLAAFAFGANAQAASVVPYTRIGLDYTRFHSTSNFDYFPDWEPSASAEGGVVFSGIHSLGIEVSYAEAKSTVAHVANFKTKKQQMPVLATYRFNHPLDDIFSIYGGVTAGVMMDKYSLATGNPVSSGGATHWIPAVGAVAGANLYIDGGWHLTSGVRMVWVRQKPYKNIGADGILNIGEQATYMRPTLTLGLIYVW